MDILLLGSRQASWRKVCLRRQKSLGGHSALEDRHLGGICCLPAVGGGKSSCGVRISLGGHSALGVKNRLGGGKSS